MANLTDINCRDNQVNGGALSINAEKNTSKNRARLITIVFIAVVLIGVGVGGYFLATRVIFAKKRVPKVTGLKVSEARKNIRIAGLSCSVRYIHNYRTNNEIVVKQSVAPNSKVDKGTVIAITLEDKDMETALAAARQSLGQANTALQEVQSMGIDTSDLVDPIKNAQAKLDSSKTVVDCTGQTESVCYWANVVINGCNTKKRAYAAQQDRNNQIAACRAAMYAYARASSASDLSISIDSISMNADCTYATAAVHGTFTSGPRKGTSTETAKVIAARRGGHLGRR